MAQTLGRLFALDTAPPVASLTRVADGGDPDPAFWLRIDPVHLLVAGDRLILTDPRSLRLTQDEAEGLAGPIRRLFADDSWHIECRHPQRWYLRLPKPAAIETVPLPVVIGRDIHPFLPRGVQASTWRRYLNEIQMLLASCNVNADRERREEPLINSVWLWGEGALPARAPAQRWTKVWSNEPLAVGLASFTQTPVADTPANADMWIRHAGAGEHLLVLESDSRPKDGDENAAGLLNRNWFAPLLRAIRRGDLDRLTLYTDRSGGFAVDARSLEPWWSVALRKLVPSRRNRLS